MNWQKYLIILIESVKPYFTKELVKKIASYIVIEIFTFSGPVGFVTKYFLRYAIKYGFTTLDHMFIRWKIKVDNKEKTQKYENVINNPDATGDDVANAGHDLLNS